MLVRDGAAGGDVAQERRFRRSVLRWQKHYRPGDFPWRRTSDHYTVLIGEILLQRTSRNHVAEVFDEFLRRWPDAEHLAKARTASIRKVIAPLGLPKRASILKKLGAEIAKLDTLPLDPAQLDALPGVGPYAAHAVPVFAGGKNLPLVDWVIARVLRRYFDLPATRRPNADADLWDLATRLVEAGRARDLWLGVLDLGDSHCRPVPRCATCPICRSCRYGIAHHPVRAGAV